MLSKRPDCQSVPPMSVRHRLSERTGTKRCGILPSKRLQSGALLPSRSEATWVAESLWSCHRSGTTACYGDPSRRRRKLVAACSLVKRFLEPTYDADSRRSRRDDRDDADRGKKRGFLGLASRRLGRHEDALADQGEAGDLDDAVQHFEDTAYVLERTAVGVARAAADLR